MRDENAIIMAAGMGKRFSPFCYKKPKGLLKVKGEVLIERQIRQLQEAGIFDITLVVGYCKEQFYYLREKYGVSIVINKDYYRYNNTSTLMCVLDKLQSTYICSSDNYFSENIFQKESDRAYYSAVFQEGKTDEWCLFFDAEGKIEKIEVGGGDAWCMMGPAYLSPEFSRYFKEILREEYKDEKTRKELWEYVYMRHLDELDMYVRKYDNIIYEFDCLDDLRKFDETYNKYEECMAM